MLKKKTNEAISYPIIYGVWDIRVSQTIQGSTSKPTLVMDHGFVFLSFSIISNLS